MLDVWATNKNTKSQDSLFQDLHFILQQKSNLWKNVFHKYSHIYNTCLTNLWTHFNTGPEIYNSLENLSFRPDQSVHMHYITRLPFLKVPMVKSVFIRRNCSKIPTPENHNAHQKQTLLGYKTQTLCKRKLWHLCINQKTWPSPFKCPWKLSLSSQIGLDRTGSRT